jgi:hypothetical protein
MKATASWKALNKAASKGNIAVMVANILLWHPEILNWLSEYKRCCG